MGTLFVVGTPIGNLEDITFRAARVLGQVALVAAEDTRVTRKLLNHLGIHKPLVSYHQHSHQERLPELLVALESGDVALVADAGMPGISDPGDELVSQAAAAGFRVEVVPGVSAVTAALALSGFPVDAFLFLGFLPRRNKGRTARLHLVRSLPLALVIFEAPHRLRATLEDLVSVLGDRDIAVGRELTKLHEEVFRGTISQAIDHFTLPRGEFVLVVAGAAEGTLAAEAGPPDPEAVRQQMAQLRETGMRAREAVATVAESAGISRRTAYRLWLQAAQLPRGIGQ